MCSTTLIETPLERTIDNGCSSLKRTMRLAYLTTKYPAVSHTFIRRELRAIERRGHVVLRLAIRQADSPPVDPMDQEEQAKTLHCLSQPITRLLIGQIRTFLMQPFGFFRALMLALRMGYHSDRGLWRHLAYLFEAAYLLPILQRNKIEHVHVHFGTNAAAVARLIRRLGGPTFSFTIHGPDEFDAPKAKDIAGKVEDAAFVVAITDFCAAQIRRWAATSDWPKIHVVRCTVGEDFCREATPVQRDSNVLVCVGRLSPQKGHLLLIDALSDIVRDGEDVKLVLVGDGELRSIIEHRVTEARLDGRVEITGYVDEAEVRRQILKSRTLVLPSFAEGLPMVIMEAFALGRPVISTHIAGIPELVRPSKNGWLVPAGNVGQLAQAMHDALHLSAEELSGMGAVGRQQVMRNHNTDIEANRLEALFVAHGGADGQENTSCVLGRRPLGTTAATATSFRWA